MLEEVDWAHRFDLKSMVHTDYWTHRRWRRAPSDARFESFVAFAASRFLESIWETR